VNVSRLSEIDAEEALQGAIEKFRRRFAEMEDDLIARGTSVGAASPDERERSWDAVKARERGPVREP
jgi:ATP diphosphatase